MTTKKGSQQQQLQQRTLYSMFPTTKKIDVVGSSSSSLLNRSIVMNNNDNNDDFHSDELNQIEKNQKDTDTIKEDTKKENDDTIQVGTVVCNESVIESNNISPYTNQTSLNIEDNTKNVVVVTVETKTSSSNKKPCIVTASHETNTTREQNVIASLSSLQQQGAVVSNTTTTETNGSILSTSFQILKTSNPQDFVNQLTIHMFDNNILETKSFLEKCLQSLKQHDDIPKEEITTTKTNHNNNISKLGKMVFPNPFEISCIQPRGRFLLSIYEYGIVLHDIKKIERIIISSNSIKHFVMFPKPEDCKNKSTKLKKSGNDNNKKNNEIISISLDMILLVFKDHNEKDNTSIIVYKNKPMTQICFQLPNPTIINTNTTVPTNNNNNDINETQNQNQPVNDKEDNESLHHHDTTYQLIPWNQQDIITKFWNNRNAADLLSLLSSTRTTTTPQTLCWSKQWMIVLSLSLEYPFRQIAYVENPNNINKHQQEPDICMNMIQKKKQFVSNTDEQISTTTSSLPYVTCYLGVQDGVLYPMEDGLLFYKPPCYYPRSILNSIICSSRGSSTSGNRYLDLTIQLTSSTTTTTTSNTTKKNNKNYMNNETQFSNIDKAEERVLQNYIHSTLIPAMQRDVSATTSINDQEESNDDMIMKSISTTVSDTNDNPGMTELNDDNDNMQSSSSNRQLRQKRKASQMAREMNKAAMSNNKKPEQENESDDDDDDEDFEILVQEEEIEEEDDTDDDDDVSANIVGDDDMDSTEDDYNNDDDGDDDTDNDDDTECSN